MLFLGLISPDQALCHAIGEQLKQTGVWQHAHFTSMDGAVSAWSGELPPLIFWDAQDSPVSDEMAAFFVERLRAAQPAPLLIVLGAPPPALEAFGVTETLSRPLRLGYLLLRLQFYQRLLQQAPDVTLQLGPWLFVPRARKLSLQTTGEEVRLTDKESALLEYLSTSSGSVPREELLASVWGYEADIDTHTLETHIYRLRRKLMLLGEAEEDVFLTDQGGYQINPLWRGA